jgi:hypothetical protein
MPPKSPRLTSLALWIFPISAVLAGTDDVATIPSWWQVDCDHYNAHNDFAGVDVTLREFPITADTVDTHHRVLTFWNKGFQYRAADHELNAPWKDVRRVSVRKIGNRNSALAVTVVTTFNESNPLEFGAIELTCWREIELVLQCHVPATIEGSPPKPHSPLRDSNGNVVAEPKYPNPYCPDKTFERFDK